VGWLAQASLRARGIFLPRHLRREERPPAAIAPPSGCREAWGREEPAGAEAALAARQRGEWERPLAVAKAAFRARPQAQGCCRANTACGRHSDQSPASAPGHADSCQKGALAEADCATTLAGQEAKTTW